MTSDRDASEREKLFWTIVHRHYFSKESKLWYDLVLLFSSFHSEVNALTVPVNSSDWSNICYAFTVPFTLHLSDKNKYTLCKFLTDKYAYVHNFDIYLSDRNDDQRDDDLSLLYANQTTLSTPKTKTSTKESVCTIKNIYDLQPLLTRAFEMYNVIEVKSDIAKCFLNIICEKLYLSHLNDVHFDVQGFEEFIYKEAQNYISLVFLAGGKKQKQALPISNIVNPMGKYLICYGNICLYELNLLKCIIHKYTDLRPVTQQILIMADRISELVILITYHAINSMIMGQNDNFEILLTSIQTVDWRVLKAIVEIVNDQIETVGTGILDCNAWIELLHRKGIQLLDSKMLGLGIETNDSTGEHHLIIVRDRRLHIF